MVTNKGVNDEINDEDLTLEPIIVPLKKQILHQTRIICLFCIYIVANDTISIRTSDDGQPSTQAHLMCFS